MQKIGSELQLWGTDLARSLSCRHLTVLDMQCAGLAARAPTLIEHWECRRDLAARGRAALR